MFNDERMNGTLDIKCLLTRTIYSNLTESLLQIFIIALHFVHFTFDAVLKLFLLQKKHYRWHMCSRGFLRSPLPTEKVGRPLFSDKSEKLPTKHAYIAKLSRFYNETATVLI